MATFRSLAETVSIHAPMQGATQKLTASILILSTFQFTLPRRERHDNGYVERRPNEFQFTLPRRERPAETARPSDRRSGFQFTVPRRKRLTVLSSRFFNTPFQFTLPRRERHCRMRYYRCCTVSIHAPAQGATCRTHPQSSRLQVSIHAPAKGAT